MTEKQIEAVAVILRQRCCNAADGRDLTNRQSEEIAREILRAVEQAK